MWCTKWRQIKTCTRHERWSYQYEKSGSAFNSAQTQWYFSFWQKHPFSFISTCKNDEGEQFPQTLMPSLDTFWVPKG